MGFFIFQPQTRFVLLDTTETTSNSTAYVNSPTTLTLPSGTYTYEGLVALTTNSTIAGGQVELSLPTGHEITAYNNQFRGTTLFGSTPNSTALRVDTNSQLLTVCFLDGGASNKAVYTNSKGVLVLTADATFGFKIAQRTTTDSANPAKLAKRSYIAFARV
jgi:hypothetical protein